MNSPLHLSVLSEVSACIGCNDCLLACPIPQARAITIAELNTAVSAPTLTNPRTIDFVSACTQCQRCVPACPADLNRANMVLVNKMKVEDSVEDHVLPLTEGDQVTDSPWTLNGLVHEFCQLELFANVLPSDVRRLILTGTMRKLVAQAEICGAGDYYERLMVVLSGELIQYVEQQDAWGQRVRTPLVGFESGAFLGEAAMMAEQPEPFGLQARKESILFELPRASVRRLLSQSVAFSRTMDTLYRQRVLFNSEHFPSLGGAAPAEAYRRLMQKAELIWASDGESLFETGQSIRGLFIVRAGFVKVTRLFPQGERVLSYLAEGALLGATGLVYRERAHAYSARAAGRVEGFHIPASDVFDAMMAFPTLGTALLEAASAEQVARSQQLAPPAPAGKQGPTHMAPLNKGALVDAGLAKGREVLVIDQTKCTGCAACTDACARRHGHGRLQLRGLQLEHLLFPTACRHCEDPVCLLCSVNGIVRRPSGEISVIEDNCVGCGACASRCPYGNITMSDSATSFKDEPFDLWSFFGFRKRKPADSANDSPMRKAHKCDLCADFSDYACVNACPTGAAFRSDLSEIVSADDGGIGLRRKDNG